MAHGLPRATENNPDHSEILLDLSAVLCQHFPIISKDFVIVYYVIIAPYTITGPVRNTMFAWGRSYWHIFKEQQVCCRFEHSCCHQLSDAFVVGIFAWMSADKEESDCLISCFDLK